MLVLNAVYNMCSVNTILYVGLFLVVTIPYTVGDLPTLQNQLLVSAIYLGKNCLWWNDTLIGSRNITGSRNTQIFRMKGFEIW